MHEQYDQLVAFVGEYLAQGYSEDEIRSVLLQRGLGSELVEQLFASAVKTNTAQVTSANKQRLGNKAAPKGMFGRRINRLGYLMGNVYLNASFIVLDLLIFAGLILFPGIHITSRLAPVLLFIMLGIGAVLLVFSIVVNLSLAIRRLHDMGRSGKLALIFVVLLPILASLVLMMIATNDQSHDTEILIYGVPVILIAFELYLQFAPGEPGLNEYGDPVSTLNFWVVLGFKKPKE